MDCVNLSPSGIIAPRKGCDPMKSTQRGKLQSQRSVINQKLCKQMRLRTGAENLYNATSNPKVKETVALELSFVNSSLQLLKEELNEINSRVDPYQNKSGKAVSIPMLPLGLKETTDLEFAEVFEEFIAEHYKEEACNFRDEIADFADMRTAVRTPSRNCDGVDLLLEYYNQLYYIENRFFPPGKPPPIYFHWYDAISGVPVVQRSVALEKASILFNVGALYSQIGTRGDRSRRKGIEKTIGAFQRSAGIFDFLRCNFINPPTPDLSYAFLSALTSLMLAQAQESELELKMLGGFEIQLGKCVNIAQASMKVAEKYAEANKAFQHQSVKSYVPYSWINMVQVKSHHYRAISHYYSGLGLLEQHEFAEPIEIAKLLSSLYHDVKDSDIPKPEEAARRKEDRKRLGKSHIRHAIFCHEQALQTHSLCRIARTIDVLKEYLHHAHQRSLSKFAEIDNEEDFFALIDAPSIQAFGNEVEVIPPNFDSVSTTDIFRRLGPLCVFSVRYRFSRPRTVTLTTGESLCDFSLHGEAPVTVNNVDIDSQLDMMNEDIIVAIDNVDMKWSNHNYIADIIAQKRESPVAIKLISAQSILSKSRPAVTCNDDMRMMLNVNNNNSNTAAVDKNNIVLDVSTTRDRPKSKHEEHVKNRHSLGIFRGLRIKALQNRFSTVVENSPTNVSNPNKKPVSVQRSSSTSTTSFLKANANALLQTRNVSTDIRSEC